MARPTFGEMLLGTEGLALLRLAATGDAAARETRIAEIRSLVARYDAELSEPLDTPEYGLGEGYRLWSRSYDSPLRLFPVEEPAVRPLLAELSPGRVLDAACGTGRHSVWLAAHGHEVVGVDASPDMLARARAKLPDARFEEGELTALPLPDGSVDAALCALALVHVPDLRPAMGELARVVRPGGRIVLSDVHPFLVALGWQAQFRTAEGGTGFMRLHRHLPSDYARAAMAAGLSVRGMSEPLLPPDSAVTVAQAAIPEANALAWAGLPGVIVWDLVKR
ncbi:MAG: class I SAM-dependent methyltransferase [Geminicoccaceae bacterium]